MKTATIIHKEIVKEYFKNNESIILTANEKLMFSLGFLEGIECKETEFNTEIAEFDYTTKQQLTDGFNSVIEQFKNLLNQFDLYIITSEKLIKSHA